MDFWKYYDGNEDDLLPDITNHFSEKEITMHTANIAIRYIY